MGGRRLEEGDGKGKGGRGEGGTCSKVLGGIDAPDSDIFKTLDTKIVNAYVVVLYISTFIFHQVVVHFLHFRTVLNSTLSIPDQKCVFISNYHVKRIV